MEAKKNFFFQFTTQTFVFNFYRRIIYDLVYHNIMQNIIRDDNVLSSLLVKKRKAVQSHANSKDAKSFVE